MSFISSQVIQGVGVGLRQPHYKNFLTAPKPDIPWLEILTDNYLFTWGLLREKVCKIREDYPMVMHSVGLNLGSIDDIDMHYLQHLRLLANDIKPAWVSDHLCWTGVNGVYSHELLPLPYTEEALQHVVRRIQFVQEYLELPLLIENVSSYLQLTAADYDEATFLNEVAKRSGCSILLDINNIYVSAHNHDFIAEDYLAAINADYVRQFHLAGFEKITDLLVDTHGARVEDEVWQLYCKALQKFGPIPTNIEWDNNIPNWSTLKTEVDKAKNLFVQYARKIDEAC